MHECPACLQLCQCNGDSHPDITDDVQADCTHCVAEYDELDFDDDPAEDGEANAFGIGEEREE